MRWLVITLFLLICAGVAGAAYVHFHDTSGGGTGATTGPAKHTGSSPVDHARAAVEAFDRAWARGADTTAGHLTDHPKRAASALIASRKGLDGASVSLKILTVDTTTVGARATLGATWQVPGFGPWHYDTAVPLRQLQSGAWKVAWTPRIIYPKLSEDTRLGTERDEPKRAPILDRTGMEILGDRAVVDVGLQRDKVTNVTASATALAKLVGLNAATLIAQTKGAGPKQFLIAVTLRPADFKPIAARLKKIPGADAIPARLPITPTHEFGRQLLGAIGSATAEQVKRSKRGLAPGDLVGQWGLEQQYDRHLAGTASYHVITRDRVTGDAIMTLATHQGRAPVPLRTTISTRVQNAAEKALGPSLAPSAIVVEQPSTGDVLAVANRPTEDTFDRALAGAYAPGSTFKVITTMSLLEHAFDPGSSVPCPATILVDGRTFKNFEGESGGSSTFDEDFAISCNTAFISLAPKLGATALTKTALEFGLGKNKDLPFGTASSHVPPSTDAVSHAAMMIGQDRIVVTPLAMAGVAATVASGRWRAPRLLSTDPKIVGSPLAANDLAILRDLMRKVVLGGSGDALASTPGEPRCKTGTAEFGTANPPATHAWFICYRGDLALSVLVEKGRSGGSVAAPIAARFFSAYDK
jgi:cell division protein FtsI/penicillin-binding protein 2